MKTFLLLLLIGFIGTYIDLIIAVLAAVSGRVNWNLVSVIALTLAILSPFISERLKNIQNRT